MCFTPLKPWLQVHTFYSCKTHLPSLNLKHMVHMSITVHIGMPNETAPLSAPPLTPHQTCAEDSQVSAAPWGTHISSVFLLIITSINHLGTSQKFRWYAWGISFSWGMLHILYHTHVFNINFQFTQEAYRKMTEVAEHINSSFHKPVYTLLIAIVLLNYIENYVFRWRSIVFHLVL